MGIWTKMDKIESGGKGPKGVNELQNQNLNDEVNSTILIGQMLLANEDLMILNKELNQARELILSSRNVLLVNAQKPDGDSIGALLATYMLLKKLGKNVATVCPDPLPDIYKFLPQSAVFSTDLAVSRDMIITVDLPQDKFEDIKYTLVNNQLQVMITPRLNVSIPPAGVSVFTPQTDFDLVIYFDFGNKRQLGSLLQDYPDLGNVPSILIDHHQTNERFATINLVSTAVSSTCELLYELMMNIDVAREFMDWEMATALLTGIIYDTGSFQHANTSPRALDIAAELMDLGADQAQIVTNIYKTKKLQTLKIWGQILSNLQVDVAHQIVWSVISQREFIELGAGLADTEGVIDELMTSAPDVQVAILIVELPDHMVKVSLRSMTKEADVSKLAQHFGGGGHVQAAGFIQQISSLFDFEHELIAITRTMQAQHLTIKKDELKSVKIITNTNIKPLINPDTPIKMINIDLSLDSDVDVGKK